MFCRAGAGEGDITKFNSEGWSGGYGCTENIESTLFPESNAAVIRAGYSASEGGIQQAAVEQPTSMFQMVSMAGIAGTAVAAFFGMRKWRQGKGQS